MADLCMHHSYGTMRLGADEDVRLGLTLICLGNAAHQASKAEDKDKQPGADTNPGSQKPAKVRWAINYPHVLCAGSCMARPSAPLCSQLSSWAESSGGIVRPAAVLSDPEPMKWRCATQVKGSVDDIFGVETGKQRKRTDEGYVIYHEDELSMNKGGDTEQCPFDCKCCF